MSDQPESVNLTNQQIIEIYSSNQKEIDKLWITMPEDATMSDAVKLWLETVRE